MAAHRRIEASIDVQGFSAALLLATEPALRGPAPPRHVVVLVAPRDESPGWIVRARRGGEFEPEPLGCTELPEGRSRQVRTKGED